MKKIFTLLFSSLLAFSAFSQTASTSVVISQIYGGGGGTGTYTFDYVELHNVSAVSQDISGFSIQYGSATGNYGSSAGNIYVIPAGTVIPAGRFLLIQVGAAGTSGAPLPVTPDLVTTNLTISQSSGKLALSNQAATLDCGSTVIPKPCTSTDFTKIVDAVSFGAASNSEGRPANDSSALNNTQGIVRKLFGCQDTQNNNADFDVVTNPVPRNSSTAAFMCSSLPLNLSGFTASLTERNVNLSWTSLNEQNVKGFEVERSANGNDFAAIGRVSATNRSRASYSFSDDSPLQGAAFYRLKMIDNDGTVKYSGVVVVNNRKSVNAQLFPNPTKGSLNVTHAKALNGAQINIMSAEGKQVKSYKVAAGTIQTNLSVSDLANGNYLLVFENDGSKSITKFVKN